jgi:hypothetical protein
LVRELSRGELVGITALLQEGGTERATCFARDDGPSIFNLSFAYSKGASHMKLGKLLLAVITATVLFWALVGSASARNFSISSQSKRATFAALEFAGGFGTVRCEVVLELTFHSRTFTKTVGTLLGYVTAANVTRCASGGATIDRETLPWHDRYERFTGTLPNILTISKLISGFSWRYREPTFGVTCQVTNATLRNTYTLTAGVVTRADLSGTAPCSGINGTYRGSTTNVDNRAGARLTITLI